MASHNFLHQRIAEELRPYHPFAELAMEDLILLAENIKVVYMPSGQWLFAEGDDLHSAIYVVSNGEVELKKGEDLIDKAERGELFGLRVLFEEGKYLAGAKTDGDALVYAIPKAIAQHILVENERTAHYFRLDWKGNDSNFVPSGNSLRRLMKNETGNLVLPVTESQRIVNYTVPVLAKPGSNVAEAAVQMIKSRSDACVVVNAQQHPIGIITDADLRKVVAHEKASSAMCVEEIMSHPVKVLSTNLSYSNAMVHMMELGIHHLVLTENGTADEPVVGIVNDHDLLLEQALNPAVLSKRIERAQSKEELVNYAQKMHQLALNYNAAGVVVSYMLKVFTSLYDSLYTAAIKLAQEQLGPAPESFAWLALGSLGRGEQLLRTDQDHAIVRESDQHEFYFLELAKYVSELMEEVGLERDHYGVSAENKLWNNSLDAWKTTASSWVNVPEGDALLQLGILMDARFIHGNLNLADKFLDHLHKEISSADLLHHQLAKDALRNPNPLNFFRQFKLEEGGDFDLKLRAILPYIDAAKLLAAKSGYWTTNSTVDRLLSTTTSSQTEWLQNAAHAYEILLQFRAKMGIEQGTTGRYIQVADLDQIDRELLRNLFRSLESLQSHLKNTFGV